MARETLDRSTEKTVIRNTSGINIELKVATQPNPAIKVTGDGNGAAHEHTGPAATMVEATASHQQFNNLVVVSNRLPVSLAKNGNGTWESKPSSGGLVTALMPILRKTGGRWIGWPGTVDEAGIEDALVSAGEQTGCRFDQVCLTQAELEEYYYGFCNEIIWPLFHELRSLCNFNRAYWNTYCSVNSKFARITARKATDEDYIWVQDYHLLLMARYLRALGVQNRIGFFLHTPFPSPEIMGGMPWCSKIMESLLEYDLLGFQTKRDKDNFTRCAERLGAAMNIEENGGSSVLLTPERKITAGVFPISIDFDEFNTNASIAEVTKRVDELRSENNNRKIALGVDRLDYSKGIHLRLRAFKKALEDYPELRQKISLIQVVVPSRDDIPEYRRLRSDIEGTVDEINRQFSEADWTPVHYIYSSVQRTELLALYRAADIALVTPVRDGMNLVAKEFCSASVDGNGVLVLSPFAGTAAQFGSKALLADPYDIKQLAAAIRKAFAMPEAKSSARMKRLRQSVRRKDIFWWADRFLQTANGNSKCTTGVAPTAALRYRR